MSVIRLKYKHSFKPSKQIKELSDGSVLNNFKMEIKFPPMLHKNIHWNTFTGHVLFVVEGLLTRMTSIAERQKYVILGKRSRVCHSSIIGFAQSNHYLTG